MVRFEYYLISFVEILGGDEEEEGMGISLWDFLCIVFIFCMMYDV